jgi:ATP dependent DNA ligase domain/DNA ligase OB-like domain
MELTNLSLVQSFPTLYAIDKNGKIKIWTAAVLQPVDKKLAAAGYASSRITHGYINGKQQVAYRDYNTGKNIGRSNETTPLAQCISETRRKWTDKKEKEAYSETKPADCGEGYGDISGGWCGDDDGGDDGGGGGDGGAAADTGPFLPMLAQTFNPADAIVPGAAGAAGGAVSKKKKVITFPCFVQPKLDGLRCVSYTIRLPGGNDAGPTVALQSRTGAFFTGLPHIAAALRPYLSQHPSVVIDGELYTDQMPFEELAGLIKKKKITESDVERLKKVKYHVYDIYDRMNENMPYSERMGVLAAAVRRCGCVANDAFSPGVAASGRMLRSAATTVVATDEAATVVVLVRTEKVAALSDFRRLFAEFVEAGYEGIMLRNAAGVYRANYRSNDLQKYKEFMEDEYRIIDFKEGEGRDAGAVIWVCETADGKEFTARPRGTMEQRREWFNDGESYIGKNLTVVYQELTEEGKPRFPVAKCVREGF